MLTKVKRDWPTTRSPIITAEDITQTYRRYLGREPDPIGLEFWINRGQEGMTLDELARAFILSDEFRGLNNFDQLSALSNLGSEEPLRLSLSQVGEAEAAITLPLVRDKLARGTFELPEEFETDLAPLSSDYKDQMLKLWSTITLRSNYNPSVDEDTPEISHSDALYRPAFYAAGDTKVSGDHLMALGHLLLLSGLKQGARALEYGAGFGQIALAFARSGIQVDTVDINKAFSDAVNKAGAYHQAPLKAHVGAFGDNPAGQDQFYDLIYFYESFHHCFDFEDVIPKLYRMLKPGGKVMMAGEPIADGPTPWMPYPWGIRLDIENVTIMRTRGWMELGFQENFIVSIFEKNGFVYKKHPLPQYHYCTTYEFTRPLDVTDQ